MKNFVSYAVFNRSQQHGLDHLKVNKLGILGTPDTLILYTNITEVSIVTQLGFLTINILMRKHDAKIDRRAINCVCA